jgi:hypothetical protein
MAILPWQPVLLPGLDRATGLEIVTIPQARYLTLP